MSFFQKIFKIMNFICKVIELFRKSLMRRSLKPMTYCVKGFTLVEAVIISVLIAGVAFGATYFLAQNKTVMLSSAQIMGCQEIAKEALESVVSLGSRLYGYKINHDNNNLSYNPVWLRGNDITLSKFPPPMYRTLFQKIGVTYNDRTPEQNSKVRLIQRVNPSIIKISTSVLLINFVNALQYLYNSNPSGYTSGDGLPITMSDLETLKSYKEKFDLQAPDIQFYMKISPVDLKENMKLNTDIKCQKSQHNGSGYDISDYFCPTKGSKRLIITRPRFHNPDGMSILPNVQIVGNPNIGFELKVLVKYTLNEQDFSCEGMHLFSHQVKNVIDPANNPHEDPFPVTASNLRSSENVDLTIDPFVSCDTDGGDYDDISLDLNVVNNSKHKQAGTIILCQMNSYCKSEGDGSHGSCSPVEGRWQMCEHIEPIGSQSWNFRTSGNTLYFDDMKTDRRYELNVGEFSIAANKLREKVLAKFYLDATRPTIGTRRIRFTDAVGAPDDGEGERNYSSSRSTSWATPPNSTAKWIQCNQKPVHFQAESLDQFEHNLRGCPDPDPPGPRPGISVIREDGTGPTNISENTKCIPPRWLDTDSEGNQFCNSPSDPGKISSKGRCESVLGENDGDVEHGRHTVTFIPSDSCGQSSGSWDLVWDTDLPGTFEVQDFNFPDNIKWLKSTDSFKYPVETVVPAKAGAGTFPKHYSVDCDQNYTGSKERHGANNEPLKCELETPDISHDDGCNPEELGVKYYHVCGGGGGSGDCRKTKWGVYAPYKANCKNVRCDPDDLLCCQGTFCGSDNEKCLRKLSNLTCSNPKDGSQDALSNCPHLGLYNCHYDLTCAPNYKGTCGSQRAGEGCTYEFVLNHGTVCTGTGDCGDGTCSGACEDETTTKSGTCGGPGGCGEKDQPQTSLEKCSGRSSVCP